MASSVNFRREQHFRNIRSSAHSIILDSSTKTTKSSQPARGNLVPFVAPPARCSLYSSLALLLLHWCAFRSAPSYLESPHECRSIHSQAVSLGYIAFCGVLCFRRSAPLSRSGFSPRG